MKIKRLDYLYIVFIFFLSIVFLFDFLINPGRLASFDAPFHITNMAQFAHALYDGDFPVIWTDGFANYGLPIGIVAHQLTSYMGAVSTLILSNPYDGFKFVSFIAVAFSSVGYYLFLRKYFLVLPSTIATFIFHFGAYRIFNFYVRGAMPEIFSGIFLPFILIGLYEFIKEKRVRGLLIFGISIFLLAITHPMMLLLYGFVFIPYCLYLFFQEAHFNVKEVISQKTLSQCIFLGVSGMLSIGASSFYLVPLLREIKYFYYGHNTTNLEPSSFFTPLTFVNFSWEYFTPQEVFTRGHIVTLGIIELILLLLGVIFVVFIFRSKKKSEEDSLLIFVILNAFILLFFMTPFSKSIYETLNFLGNIQFTWRMLSGLLFLLPIIAAYLLSKKRSYILAGIIVILVVTLRFPQLYGKNYTFIPKETYYKTNINVHSVLMNTIWSGKSEDYPEKKVKGEIIAGEGKIIEREEKNSERLYTVTSDKGVRMVDNTFYFPGWNVYIDGTKTNIQFQDPEYRGVITYDVPPGEHKIEMKFEDTKLRLLSKIISIISVGVFILLVIMRKKVMAIIQ